MATLARPSRDVIATDNNLVQTGYVFLNPRMYLGAFDENSTVTYDGDFVVCDNTLANLDGYVLDNSVTYGAYGYSEILLISDVIVSGNTVLICDYDVVEVVYDAYSFDNSTVVVTRDIMVADNIIGQTSNLFDYSIGNLEAYDDSVVTFQGDVLILNNIVDDAEDDVLYANFGAYVADRSCASVDASLRFEGNQVNCTNDDGDPAVSIYRWAEAYGEAESAINVEVCVLDNVIALQSHGGIYLSDYCQR